MLRSQSFGPIGVVMMMMIMVSSTSAVTVNFRIPTEQSTCSGQLIQSVVIANGGCADFEKRGLDRPWKVTCDGNTATSKWTLTVYSGATCEGSTNSVTGNVKCSPQLLGLVEIDCSTGGSDVDALVTGLTIVAIVIYVAIGIGICCSLVCFYFIIKCLFPNLCRRSSPSSSSAHTLTTINTNTSGHRVVPAISSSSGSGYSQHFDIDHIETELGVLSPSSEGR